MADVNVDRRHLLHGIAAGVGVVAAANVSKAEQRISSVANREGSFPGGAAASQAPLPKTFRQWIYAKPMQNGRITLEQFAVKELPMPEPQEGQALVRIKLVGIHPRVRQSMSANGSLKPGESEPNFACAEVIKSRDPSFKEGDIIACQSGWQEFALVSSKDGAMHGYGPAPESVKELNRSNSQWTYVFRPSMVREFAPEDLIGLCGTTGLTGYFGVRQVGPLMPGDAVASAASTGATGSICGQLAKIAGCYVVGFAGGPEKCKWAAEELGFDKCIDYRARDLEDQVKAAFPKGIDVFLDGVAGEVRAAVLKVMNPNSRMLNYGSSSFYYGDSPVALQSSRPGTAQRALFGVTEDDMRIFKQKNIKVESWIVHDFYYDRITAENELTRMVRSKQLKPINTVYEGFEKLPEAIISAFSGSRYGKLSVRFS